MDDEIHARENLKMLIEEFCAGIDVVGDASNIDDAEALISQLSPEVLFLDIRMPSGSEGFELLQRINTDGIFVVFVTAFKDYAIQAFKANAINYILKPVDIEDLKNACAQLISYSQSTADSPENRAQYSASLKSATEEASLHSKPQHITLFHSKGFKIVKQSDILRIQADGNCSWIYFATGEPYYDTRTLGFYDEVLDSDRFLRVHKSHTINLDFLVEYLHADGHTAKLKNGHEVPVARARLSQFLSRVKNR